MERLIEDWLKEIPEEDVREAALRNRANEIETDGYYADYKTARSLRRAIADGFEWVATQEGHDFWFGVYNSLLAPSPDNKALLDEAVGLLEKLLPIIRDDAEHWILTEDVQTFLSKINGSK